MANKRQKALGLDTFKVEDVCAGHANSLRDLMRIVGEHEGKTQNEVFQDLTKLFAVHVVGEKEAERAIWNNVQRYRRDFD